MLPRITQVRYLGGYAVELTFTTGEIGVADFTDDLTRFYGVLSPLRDAGFFAQVKVDPDSGTIVWPGDIDLDPDALYAKATGAPLPEFARSTAAAK